jgi:hypothetical protein
MRIKLGVALTTAVLITVLLPGTAGAATLTVARTPGGGPGGTTITLSGTCDADNQVSAQLRNKDSDALGDFGHGVFSVGPGGTWRGSVTVNGNGAMTPFDLDLSVTCGPLTQKLPFFLTDRNTTSAPNVVTALAGDGCAVAMSGGYMPCPPHFKGFANGVLTKANVYADDGTGGASVAVADVDGAGQPEIIVGSGPGHDPRVWIFTLDGTPVSSFVPYDAGFKGGVNVAAADLNGDRKAEIITGVGPGGGPNVRVFSGSGQPLASFFAYTPAFRGGVNVAAGNVNNDGKMEIITGAGPGGGPHVRGFTPGGTPIGGGFFAYDPHFIGGVSVAAGPGRIVTGAGPGGGPHVRVFETTAGNSTGGGFFAYDPAFTGGVWVGLGPNGIVTGPGSGGGPNVRTFGIEGVLTSSFTAYEGAFTAGVKVAAVLSAGSGTTSTSGPGGSSTSTAPGGTSTSG